MNFNRPQIFGILEISITLLALYYAKPQPRFMALVYDSVKHGLISITTPDNIKLRS